MPSKYLKFAFSFLFPLFFFVQCENTDNKKAVNKYIESNIEYCMSPLIKKGVDSIRAREICQCGLEKMFMIEPNLFKA